MIAKKDNKVYNVDEVLKERFKKEGYDILDDNGNVIEYSYDKKIEYAKYLQLENELKETKEKLEQAENELAKQRVTNEGEKITMPEIKEKLDALGIEYSANAKKEDLIKLLPKED